jgi:Cu/Ag efflux pump CusA
MWWPRRFTVVVLAFFGFLILFGFRTVFTMVMVYVIKDNENDGVTLFKEVLRALCQKRPITMARWLISCLVIGRS